MHEYAGVEHQPQGSHGAGGGKKNEGTQSGQHVQDVRRKVHLAQCKSLCLVLACAALLAEEHVRLEWREAVLNKQCVQVR